jgi:diguanylate cyclase (GGDEF)-like protein
MRTAQSLIASEAKATHLALHDFLTGLANRRLFADRLAQALEQARRAKHLAAVICLDLDRFKEVNDTFGHHVGDELVQLVALRLQELCRASDTLARLGGDEFAILIPDGAPSGALALCDRITATFMAPMRLSVGPIHVKCSMGISLAQGGGVSADELMRQADLALYRAKDLGGNRHCFFEQEMDAALRRRRALEEDLRQALADGALELFYQPQVDGAGRMTGVEALVRWTHPARGAVSPTVFVPIAEECGLIGELGRFTLRQAFSDSARWPHLTVAVNVSARQLTLPRFLDDIAALVAEERASPGQLELELSERLLLDDDEHTHAVLRQLKAMGFSLALDDFGAGVSSLSCLRHYPIDKIKLGRSFIANLGIDPEAPAVVGAIVTLARALGLRVIAEGVETAAQRDLLIQVGCLEAQGHLFSPPAQRGQIDAFAANRPFERRRGAGSEARRRTTAR